MVIAGVFYVNSTLSDAKKRKNKPEKRSEKMRELSDWMQFRIALLHLLWEFTSWKNDPEKENFLLTNPLRRGIIIKLS